MFKKGSIPVYFILSILVFINLTTGHDQHDHEHINHQDKKNTQSSEQDHIHDQEHNREAHQHSASGHAEHEHHDENQKETNLDSHDHEADSHNSGLHDLVKVKKIKPEGFVNTVYTTGTIKLDSRNEYTIIAQSNGRVEFKNSAMVPGQFIEKDAVIFSVSGSGLIDDNLTLKYTQAKNDFYLSRKNFERAQYLAKNDIIAKKELDRRKVQYISDSTRFHILKNNFAGKDMEIKSPVDGKLFKLFIQNGDYVREGQKLAIVHSQQELILNVDLPKQHYSQIEEISEVAFKQEHCEKIHRFESCQHSRIGVLDRLTPGDPYLSLSYKLDRKSDLIPGSFAEVWLGIDYEQNSIVVPKSAILEQQGLYFVFVKKGENDYHKTQIEIDCFNSRRARVRSGLHSGDQVVVDGALELKINQMGSGASNHQHNH